MRPLLAFLVVILFAAHARAQAHYPQPSPAELQKLEAALERNPQDREARSTLLEDYFYGRLDPAVAVPARRRHILWLIENTPDDKLAGSPEATIDPSGHRLADSEGFKLASAAWRAQAAKPDVKPEALVNAAYFFKTDDKAFTISLLKRALALDPNSKEISARLGDEYALVIMGITSMTWSGYPLRADPNLTQSALAKQAREVLNTSRNPYLVAKAGYMLLWQGAVLYYSRSLPFDTTPLAKNALDRAVSLAPGDPGVAGLREEYNKWQREKQRLIGSAGRAREDEPLPPANRRPVPGQASSAAPVHPDSALASASPAPAVPQLKAEDLKKVTAGMSREQVLQMGSPAGRITMDEDGHLIEIFQYSTNGTRIGSVRLTDGTVSNVQLQ